MADEDYNEDGGNQEEEDEEEVEALTEDDAAQADDDDDAPTEDEDDQDQVCALRGAQGHTSTHMGSIQLNRCPLSTGRRCPQLQARGGSA